jgi:hypothetical protein
MNGCRKLFHSQSSPNINSYSESLLLRKLIFSLSRSSNIRTASLQKENKKNISERIIDNFAKTQDLLNFPRPSKGNVQANYVESSSRNKLIEDEVEMKRENIQSLTIRDQSTIKESNKDSLESQYFKLFTQVLGTDSK